MLEHYFLDAWKNAFRLRNSLLYIHSRKWFKGFPNSASNAVSLILRWLIFTYTTTALFEKQPFTLRFFKEQKWEVLKSVDALLFLVLDRGGEAKRGGRVEKRQLIHYLFITGCDIWFWNKAFSQIHSSHHRGLIIQVCAHYKYICSTRQRHCTDWKK